MSEHYRDDSHSIAVASDGTWLGLKSIVEESAKATATVMFGLGVLHADVAIASDHIEDRSGLVSVSQAVASDEVIDFVEAKQFISERAKAADRVIDKTYITIEELANAQDFVFEKLRSTTVERSTVGDEVLSIAYKNVFIEESAKAKDEVFSDRYLGDLLEDSAAASDKYTGKLRASVIVEVVASASDETQGFRQSFYPVTDTAKATDHAHGLKYAVQEVLDEAKASDTTSLKLIEVVENEALASDIVVGLVKAKILIEDVALASDETTGHVDGTELKPVTDSAKALSETWGHLHAFNLITETIVAEDTALSTDGVIGQAWTANADNWAMSRYEPYTFHSMAVIDGVAYGVADDGIYQLSDGVEEIEGSIATGKLDLGGGALVHPVSAYLEYELEGTASIEVSTTQLGIEQRFTYPLAPEVANDLTNGRFIFGRGLRGRHFSFTLRVEGVAAYVNDLSVHSTETGRRV